MKNSEMVLQAILNNPDDLDAYRAYIDTLLEEGAEAKGNFLLQHLGKSFEVKSLDRKLYLAMLLEDSLVAQYLNLEEIVNDAQSDLAVTMTNGFISHIRCSQKCFRTHAKTLFKNHPICSVFLFDRHPYSGIVLHDDIPEPLKGVFWLAPVTDDAYDALNYLNHIVDNYLDSNLLLVAITKHLRPAYCIRWPLTDRTLYQFSDLKLALEEASLAAVKCGREFAGLPPLPTTAYKPLSLVVSGFN